MPPEGGINLEYLRNNPVKRGFVSSPGHWRYSSAHGWLAGAELVLCCDLWLEDGRSSSFGDECVPKPELGHEGGVVLEGGASSPPKRGR